MEFRIYYECLEQALFFAKEILLTFCDSKKIKLIKKIQQQKNKKTGRYAYGYSQNLNKVYSIKNPDLVITLVMNGFEQTIIIIEFSTAVYTKDHELQRSDNYIAALKSNSIFIKISTLDKISSAHGGDTKFNFIEPYSLFYKRYGIIHFHINWKTENNNSEIVEKHKLYKSIPNKLSYSEDIFKSLYNFISSKNFSLDSNWNKEINNFYTNKTIIEWIKKIKNYKKFENIKDFNSSRTKWFDKIPEINKKNILKIKINRMGHAMDPERGLLTYYSFLHVKSKDNIISKFIFDKKIKTWYLSTPKSKEIEKILNNPDISNSRLDLVKFLCLGLSFPNMKQLLEIVKKKITERVIDVDEYFISNYKNCNNSIKTIVNYSSYLEIGDNKDFFYLKFGKEYEDDISYMPKITKLKKRNTIDEDDITFIFIHQIFNKKNTQIISVSYPGAQSDTPFLPEAKTGRSQKRVYIDAVILKDKKLYLCEIKNEMNAIKNDIDKLLLFKKNKNYKDSIKKFAKKNKFSFDSVVLVACFGVKNENYFKRNFANLNFNDLDFFYAFCKEESKCIFFKNGNEFRRKKFEVFNTFKVDKLNSNINNIKG